MRSRRILAASLLTTALLPAGVVAQDWSTLSRSRAVSSETALEVNLEYGAGTLRIAPATGGMLYRAQMRYDASIFEPRMNYSAGQLDIGFRDGRMRGRNLRAGNLDLSLGTGVPIDLELKFGAAEADLDLSGMRITRARISTGASKTRLRIDSPNPELCRSLELEIGAAQFEAVGLANLRTERLRVSGGVGEIVLDFTGEWTTDMTANVEMGLGSLVLRLPRGLGVSVRKGGILAGFDSQGLTKQGDVYLSENWETAQRRLTMNLDAALGSIRVAWVDGR
jgi:hypothetical protein